MARAAQRHQPGPGEADGQAGHGERHERREASSSPAGEADRKEHGQQDHRTQLAGPGVAARLQEGGDPRDRVGDELPVKPGFLRLPMGRAADDERLHVRDEGPGHDRQDRQERAEESRGLPAGEAASHESAEEDDPDAAHDEVRRVEKQHRRRERGAAQDEPAKAPGLQGSAEGRPGRGRAPGPARSTAASSRTGARGRAKAPRPELRTRPRQRRRGPLPPRSRRRLQESRMRRSPAGQPPATAAGACAGPPPAGPADPGSSSTAADGRGRGPWRSPRRPRAS